MISRILYVLIISIFLQCSSYCKENKSPVNQKEIFGLRLGTSKTVVMEQFKKAGIKLIIEKEINNRYTEQITVCSATGSLAKNALIKETVITFNKESQLFSILVNIKFPEKEKLSEKATLEKMQERYTEEKIIIDPIYEQMIRNYGQPKESKGGWLHKNVVEAINYIFMSEIEGKKVEIRLVGLIPGFAFVSYTMNELEPKTLESEF